jgi:hypothetical protein
MAAYPGTLPQLQLLPVSFTRQDARLVSQFDAGPAKVRRKYSDAPYRFSTKVGPFSKAEMASFWSWWKTTLAEGSLTFTWEDPQTFNTVTMRFDPRQPPPSFEAQGVEGEVKYFTVYSLEITV